MPLPSQYFQCGARAWRENGNPKIWCSIIKTNITFFSGHGVNSKFWIKLSFIESSSRSRMLKLNLSERRRQPAEDREGSLSKHRQQGGVPSLEIPQLLTPSGRRE